MSDAELAAAGRAATESLLIRPIASLGTPLRWPSESRRTVAHYRRELSCWSSSAQLAHDYRLALVIASRYRALGDVERNALAAICAGDEFMVASD